MDDNEALRQVIQLYESNRLLWDAKSSEYYNKNKREDAWREISVEVNIPVKELKKKVNSLLGSYRRDKSREKKSRVTGSGADDIYTSKWFAYTWFKFLVDKNIPSNTSDSMSDNVQDLLEENQDNSNASTSTVGTTTTSTSQSAVTSTPTSSLAEPSQRTRKRRAVDEKMHESMLKSAYDILRRTSEEPNDHYASFGNHVANELRKYDLHTLPYVKKAILDILFQADTGRFSDTHQGYYTAGYYSSHASSSSPSSTKSTMLSPYFYPSNSTPTPPPPTPPVPTRPSSTLPPTTSSPSTSPAPILPLPTSQIDSEPINSEETTLLDYFKL